MRLRPGANPEGSEREVLHLVWLRPHSQILDQTGILFILKSSVTFPLGPDEQPTQHDRPQRPLTKDPGAHVDAPQHGGPS
jgi:hypothetical protein